MTRVLKSSIAVAGLLALCGGAVAQDRIYRCGNEYTNNVNDATARGCKLVEGGNVTVVQSQPVPAGGVTNTSAPVRSPAASAAPAGSPRVDSADQRARDSDARNILEAELRKAETRHSQLLKDYNNGEPEKTGIESRNYARYQERVEEMKVAIQRSEADIGGLKRELSRLPASK
ncbi:hypothetical protein ACO2Q9_16750 [Variovorax sp. VNK109]|jgi:hypothetical protein|uniref:hypothetical protein n=1 Tax=Variovorax sp. VNK109 TaxID=3400919 RepID=UPI003C01BEA5